MSDQDAQKAVARAVFNEVAVDYDADGAGIFAHFGRQLVRAVGIATGERVLDVATGRGAVLFPAAEAVGATGAVVGIDLAEDMVRTSGEEARRRGLSVRLLVMDAERLDFPDASFDRVLCGFGVMFFPQLPHALAEAHRVLAPGGQLGVSTWRASHGAEFTAVLDQLGCPGAGGYYRNYREPDELRAMIAAAGFTDVRITEERAVFRFADAGQFWDSLSATWQRQRLSLLDAAQTARARAALAARLRPDQQADGIHRTVTALFAAASR